MHTSAAAKSLERINLLINELSKIIEFEGSAFSCSSSRENLPSVLSNNTLALMASPSTTGIPSVQDTTTYHEAIKDVSVTVKSRFFSRKPRCLLFPGSPHDDLMITSSLEGFIQYCSMKNQSVMCTYHIPSLLGRTCHAEDMCKAPPYQGLLLSSIDMGPSGIKNEPDPCNSPSSIVFLPFDHREIMPVVITSPYNPHKKAISTIESLDTSTTSASDYFVFCTGGLDKNVALWKLNSEIEVVDVQEIHRVHTSVVQAVAQTKGRGDLLWTGGADCRLVGWSLEEGRQTFSHRFAHKISFLFANENHPNTLLASFCSHLNQLQLLDTRAPLSQNIIAFGHLELSTTSRYLRPSWSPNGNLIVMGTSAPQSRISSIDVWDIRCLRNESAPVKSIGCCAERRFLACDFWPSGNTIVALGSDCSASFVDFTTL